MKTYVLILSRTFHAKHPRKGEQTNFDTKLLNAVWRAHNMSIGLPQYGMKLHTIRSNYALWSKRFKQIYEGKAALSIRYWTGKPYHSKQTEICKLTKEDGIGLQRLQFIPLNNDLGNFITSIDFRCHRMPEALNLAHELASNDGLTFSDWKEWIFGSIKYNISKPLAIIHFTKFRY